MAEQQLANNAYRVQVLEGWYFWCNQTQGGHPNAAQSWWPNPANSGDGAWRPKREKKPDHRARSLSNVTRMGSVSEASSAPTVLPRASGMRKSVETAEAIPEVDNEQKKKRRRKPRRRAADDETGEGMMQRPEEK